MSKSGQYTRNYAIHIFSMLLCVQEALSPEALIQAMTTVPEQEEEMTLAKMLDICFNLVVLDSELNVLRFAHISFQEFLETREEFASYYIHRVAALRCLDSCLEGFPTGTETDICAKDDFHLYSAVYWAEHCKITILNGTDDVIISKMREFAFDGSDVALSFVDWIQEVNNLAKKLPNDHALAKELRSVTHPSGSPLFTACVFGLAPIIDDLAHTAAYDWNLTNDLGQSGLYLAAAAGHRTIVQSLLQHEVYVNNSGGKFGFPLHAACFGGHLGIVELLVDHGADPKLGPRSALEYALLADHEDIVLFLLDGKLDISNQAEYDSILQQAAEAGFAEVVQSLQKKYAYLYGDVGSSRCRFVEVAIFKGCTGMVKRYMQKLSDPRTCMPQDAIATAALGGQDAMVSLLMDQGLNLIEEGMLGTPLRAASIMGHESTVRLLLRLGASLHVSGSFGEPLQAAAMRGHESITKTLLGHGANVNSKGGLYGTALQAAAHRGHQKVVEILLDAGADVHQSGFSCDAFHAASEGGHEGIVRLLLERGFKVRHPLPGPLATHAMGIPPHRSLLRDASLGRLRKAKPIRDYQPVSIDWRERASVIEFSHVIERMRGAVTSELELIQPYRERHGYSSRGGEDSALCAAAAQGHITVVKLLLSQLDRIAIPKSEVVAAFEEACMNGRAEVVSQLLSDRVEIGDLKPALEAAAFHGHLTVVNLLIDHENRLGLTREDTYECDSTARAILSSGSEGGHLPIFKRGQDLVAQRCTNAASRRLYGEALTTAAANGMFNVTEALLESKSEFDLEELSTTLDSVCAFGSQEILQQLLTRDWNKVLGIQQFSSGLSKAARNHKGQVVMYWLEEHPEHHNLVVDPATVIDVSEMGFMDILPPLIEQIRSTDSFEKTLSQCLQVASRNCHPEVLEYLIREGADVNTVVEEARALGITRKLSPLQAALISSNQWTGADALSRQRSIEILLAKGADPNMAGGYDRYPLNIAAEYATVEIVQTLISSGAHAEAATKKHGTALEAAACRELGGLPIIKALLEASARDDSIDPGKIVALNEALSFFESFDGKFKESTSIIDVLETGPGAIVKILLANLSEEKADDSRYGLLLQMACMAGDRECVELLLQRGMDVNSVGNYYGTALQAASRVGNIEIAEHLLISGADVNILQGAHGTALRAAALGGHEDLVRNLIARGASVNLRYKDRGDSVLHLALQSRNPAVFKTLLVAGADTDTKMPDQQHILIAACKHGDTAVVKFLLASGIDCNLLGTAPSQHEATPLSAACAEGHLSVVQLLLDHGADIENANQSSTTPLIVTIRESHRHAFRGTRLSGGAEDCALEIVKELLSAGAVIGGPFSQGNALAEACEGGQHTVIELLLESLSGSQYEAEICSGALAAAIHRGDDKTLCLLLEHGVFPSFELLRRACSAGMLEAARTLVHEGIDINQDDGADAPLLHVAASHSRPSIVQFLINRGANVKLRSSKYGTPLIAALEGTMAPFLPSSKSCQSLVTLLPHIKSWYDEVWGYDECLYKPGYKEVSKCEQIVRSLFDAGVEMDTTTRSFGNALHLASYMGSEVIVRQLLERMEEINIFGGYFESPLVAALEGDHPSIVELLLDCDVDVNRSSPDLGSPLHYACGQWSKKLIRRLLDHGADINAYDDKHGSPLAAATSPHTDQAIHADRPSEEQRAIVELLLRHEPKVKIRECDLLAAASWTFSSDKQYFMSRFFSHDQSTVATEAVLIKIIDDSIRLEASDESLIMLLLERDGGLGTTPAMLKTAKHVEVMKMLLNHKPVCEVTTDILESAAKKYNDSSKFVKLLLAHDSKATITGAMIMAALRYQNSRRHKSSIDREETALKLLLDRNRQLNITDEMLEAAEEMDDLQMLLQRRSKEQRITSKVLERAAERYRNGATLVSRLLEHDRSVKITSPVVRGALVFHYGTEAYLRTLFEHDSTIDIAPEHLIGFVKRWQLDEDRKKVLDVLFEYGKTVEFTAETRRTIDERFQRRSDKEMKELFYRLERRQVYGTNQENEGKAKTRQEV